MTKYITPELIAAGARAAGASVIKVLRVDRRTFLRGSAAGLALAAFVRPSAAFEEWPTGGTDMPHGLKTDPLVFVSIDPDGTVTIVAHRSEMGQGSRTSLPMVLADEMGADWARVKVIQAEGDEPKYGNQDTDGSRSIRHHVQAMRQMGAAARAMIVAAAAKQWGVAADAVTVGVHEVTGPGGKALGFGELAEAAMAEPVPGRDALSFRDPGEFRYIGKGEVPIVDLHDITTGKAIYGADVMLDGMRFAVIARPPVVGGKVASFDAAEAMKVQGVEQVVELSGTPAPAKFAPLGGVAVVATNTWAALQGRDALKIEWEDGQNAGYSTAAFLEEMKKTAEAPDKVIRDKGDAPGALGAAEKVVDRTYTQAHMAHIPMEPPAAVARFADGKLELWAPVQSPWGTREDVAKDLGIPVEDVTVHVTLLGGGFGRKSKCDFAIEAARLAKKTGHPVRVQWTREDDIRNGYLHTTSVERIRAGVDRDGKVTAWHHTAVAPTIMSTFAPDDGYPANWESGMGHNDVPFDIPAIRCDNGRAMSHARIGWYRSVSNVPHAWAIQSFAAELAHELGRDQKEMLLELIGPARKLDLAAEGMPDDFWNYGEPYDHFPIDTGRLAHVLDLAADGIGWGREMPKGEGLGLAAHRSFVTYVGCAAHVRVGEDGRIRVPEMHLAIDCGYPVNPERIESQLQGAAVMGMTLALHSGITFDKGQVQQSNYYDYDVVRADNHPEKVVVHIVPHPFDVHPTGVGEPGVPPVAPAIANAVFNATGRRLRDLPMGEYIAS